MLEYVELERMDIRGLVISVQLDTNGRWVNVLLVMEAAGMLAETCVDPAKAKDMFSRRKLSI